MKRINQWLLIATAVILVSCVDEYTSDFMPDKPSSLVMPEFLNSYDVLKSNITPTFKLGTGIAETDFTNQQTLYSLTCSNFNEITVRNVMYHSNIATEDGALNFGSVQTLIELAKQSDVSVFGHPLLWHSNQSTFLDKSIAPVYTPEIIIPANVKQGTAMLLDFENDPLGKEYPMTAGTTGKSKVVDDAPGRAGNKVLQIGSREAQANQSLPIFEVKLPEGINVGHCVELIFDAYCVDGIGQYGQGMRVSINGKQGTSGTNFSAVNNKWGEMSFDLSLITSLTAEDKAANEFTLEFGNRTGGAFFYFDNIRMKYATAETGSVDIDFESNNIGDTYPMTVPANGVATVIQDPVGTGKVLSIGSASAMANQSEPIFTFKMPQGKTLGHCKRLVLDIYVVNNNGIYGQGVRMRINGKEGNGDSFSALGAQNNAWARGISVPIYLVPLTAEDKALTEFTLSFGNKTGGGHYLYDNIKLEWELGTEPTVIPEQIIWKTDSEVKEILTNSMESWISGLMEASDGYVKTWEIINEPMDDADPSKLKSDPNPPTDPKNWTADQNFYWQDYLGKDYARTAVGLARKHGGNDLKLFVNEYGLETNENLKCKGLINMINYWESDGVTKIDGIGAQMHVTYSLDPEKQKLNENGIEEMFKLLAKTNKLIRISQFDMNITNANGAAISMSNVTVEQQIAMSKYYNFIVRKYFEIIPAAQRYGITIWNSVESTTHVGLWTGNPYNRKITYSGFADGLSQKENVIEGY